MTPPLFLLDELPTADDLLLNGDEGRHAARVMRLRPGEELLVSDGHGALLRCRVREVIGDALQLRVLSRESVQAPDPRLVVVQGLPKGERAELAVETMTELGVDTIVPWSAARSIRQWRGARGEKAVQRWRRSAREAAKQSRRAWIPSITEPVDGPQAVARVQTADCGLVLHEDGGRRLGDVRLPGSGEVVIVVGPEGGISPEEIAAFEDAGAVTVRLGAAVLRTSTAGPAALAALSLRLGRWGQDLAGLPDARTGPRGGTSRRAPERIAVGGGELVSGWAADVLGAGTSELPADRLTAGGGGHPLTPAPCTPAEPELIEQITSRLS